MRSARHRGTAWPILLALLTISTPCWAASTRTRIAIVEVTFAGDVSPETKTELGRGLVGGLVAAGYEVTRPRGEKAGEVAELLACSTTPCFRRAQEIVGADRFVKAKIEIQGIAYSIELELLGPEMSGGVVTQVERFCPACTLSEANDTIARAGLELGNRTTQAQPSAVAADETGRDLASVSPAAIGAPVAATIPAATATPGDRLRTAVASENPLSAPSSARSDAPPEHPLFPERLESVPAARPSQEEGNLIASLGWTEKLRDRDVRERLKWAGIAGTAAAIASGIALIALDGNGTNCAGGGSPCRDVYDTMTGGVALTGMGGVIGATTAWLLFDRGSLPQLAHQTETH
ncbi:MAG: hypothetical protein V2A73_15460 [Pseudomonadota bacterium]